MTNYYINNIRGRFISIILIIVVFMNMFSIVPSAAVEIKTGDYVQFGRYSGEPLLWRCVNIDENGPLMLTDKIIAIKPFDAAGSVGTGSHKSGFNSGIYRITYGSNYWKDSNIRVWLNSSAYNECVDYICGNPPTNNKIKNEAGFLANFTSTEISAIRTVTLKSLLDAYENTSQKNAFYHTYEKNIEDILQNYDDAYSENIEEMIFLPDVKQIYDIYMNGNILGSDYYIGTLSQTAVDNYGSSALNVGDKYASWLRSPRASTLNFMSTSVRYVKKDGDITNQYACTVTVGVRPAFYINTAFAEIISGCGSKDEPYIIESGVDDSVISNPPPSTAEPTTEPVSPKPTGTEKPTESSVPTTEPVSPKPTGTEKPTESSVPTPKPIETEKPTESSVPTDKPIETEKPTESSIPTDKPTGTEKPTESSVPTTEPVSPKPTGTEKPTESSVPTPKPIETEKPTESSVPTDKPIETEKPIESSVPTDEPVSPEPTEAINSQAPESPVPTAGIPIQQTPIPTRSPDKIDAIGIYSNSVKIEKETDGKRIMFTVTSLDGTDLSGIKMFIAVYDLNGRLTGVRICENIEFNNRLMLITDMPVMGKYMMWDKYMHPVMNAKIYY